ncbi:MAG: hypothetical protein ACOZCO_13610 [Bacteroidota bacterium]
MANRIFIGEDGFIHHIYEGDQTFENVQKDVDTINALLAQMRKQNLPAKVLGNFSKIGKADSGARKAAGEAIKYGDFDKLALYGKNIFHTVAANLIITATGQRKRVRVFQTKEKAVEWLKK